MSEAMQQAILRMPPECWRNEEPLDVGQRHSAYVAAADRLLELERENAALRALLKEAADYLDPTDAPCRREGPLVARILAKLQEGQP